MEIEEIEKVKEKIDITKTDKHLGMSFVIRCNFFSVDKYPNVYLTDYDTKKDVSLLETKNLLYLFHSHKGKNTNMYISMEFIEQSSRIEIDQFLNEFYKKTQL
jgi:hypothetical protein